MVYQVEPNGSVYFMNCLVGKLSHDNYTFILYRHSYQRVRKHNAYGMSKVLLEALIKKGCKFIIIAVDGKNKYRVKSNRMLWDGIKDRLEPRQALHVFMPIDQMEEIK